MRESEGEAVRVEELLAVLEQSAKAHWNAPDKASADRALERWYSALREIGSNKVR